MPRTPSTFPFSRRLRRRAINPTPPKRVKAWGAAPWGQRWCIQWWNTPERHATTAGRERPTTGHKVTRGRFRTWTNKSLCVFEFRDSYVLSLWTFDVHFAHGCIWLWYIWSGMSKWNWSVCLSVCLYIYVCMCICIYPSILTPQRNCYRYNDAVRKHKGYVFHIWQW